MSTGVAVAVVEAAVVVEDTEGVKYFKEVRAMSKRLTGKTGEGYWACTRCRNVISPREIIEGEIKVGWAPVTDQRFEMPVCPCGKLLSYEMYKNKSAGRVAQ